MTGESFEEQWPRYPSDGSGHSLMDLTVDCDVDKLFKLQWDSSSEFLVRVNAALQVYFAIGSLFVLYNRAKWLSLAALAVLGDMTFSERLDSGNLKLA